MKMRNRCLPCIARGSLDIAKLATDDADLQKQVIQTVLKKLSTHDMKMPPPLMARFLQETVSAITGVDDPYKSIKKKYNDFSLNLFPELKKKVDNAPFETAVRLAIAGNIIDFGTHTTVGVDTVLQTIDQALETEINGDVKSFEQACKKAKRILWIADNAGEIVFDKLLLGKLDTKKIIYAVRGDFTQNDATMEDAVYTGITKMVTVIDTGAAIPGVLLEYCSKEFNDAYENADLILSKGQGNLETLDVHDPRIFFLFKAKCPVVAEYAGCQLGDIVIKTINQ